MRLYLLVCFAFVAGLRAQCQDKEQLVGVWTVGLVNDERAYMDFSKDSIYISEINLNDNLTQSQKDSALNASKKMLTGLFSTITMKFGADNNFEFKGPFKESLTGTYKIDNQKKVILIKEKGGREDEMGFELKDGFLFLKTRSDDEDMKMGLRKIN